jgi:hypothetical protein
MSEERKPSKNCRGIYDRVAVEGKLSEKSLEQALIDIDEFKKNNDGELNIKPAHLVLDLGKLGDFVKTNENSEFKGLRDAAREIKRVYKIGGSDEEIRG